MDRHKPSRNPYLLISGVSGLILLSGFVNIFAPDAPQKIALFLVLLMFSTGLLMQFFFRRTLTSVIVSCGVVLFFILRLAELRSPVYAALLIACVLSLELTVRKR